MIGRHCVLATEFRERFNELAVIAASFQHKKLAIGFTFFFEIAINSDLAVAEYQNLIAAFFNVEQQMRREHDLRMATVANLANEFDHSQTRRRIESVCRFIEKDQFWTMTDRLRK